MSDLADNVDSLKRTLARPGLFASLFPETTDDDLTLVLRDGLAHAQLDGLLIDYETDDDGVVEPDLSRPQVALIVLYSGLMLLRAELLNRKTHRRYEASGAVFEEDQATNILRDLLRNAEARVKTILQAAEDAGMGAAVYIADAYYIRALADVGDYPPLGWS